MKQICYDTARRKTPDIDFLSCISVWKLTQHWLDGDDGNN